MAIDAKLLVLDEPTLGPRHSVSQAVLRFAAHRLFDRSRTIVVTTHQVEEIQNVLTDVMLSTVAASFSIAAWKSSSRVISKSW